MRRTCTLIAGAGLLAGLLVSATPNPAAADGITATSSGTILTVSATGEVAVHFDCNGGNVRISGAFSSPPIACTTVNHVNVIGDNGAQTVWGTDLNDPVFTAHPYLVAITTGGSDSVYGTDRADSITTGAGSDDAWVTTASVVDTTIDLGADNDQLVVDGSSGPDTMSVASTGTPVSLSMTDAGGTTTQPVSGVETVGLRGLQGADTLSSAGVLAGTSLAAVNLVGGDGDDHLTGGGWYSNLYGGPGTNALTGGSGNETIASDSDTDTVSPGGGNNRVYDDTSLHLGRTVDNQGSINIWDGTAGRTSDAVIRYRPTGPYLSLVTASLDRPGQQALGTTFAGVAIGSGFAAPFDSHHLFDALAPQGGGMDLTISGDTADNDPVDVTVTDGSWTTTGTPGTTYQITTTSTALGDLTLNNVGTVSIHGPWVGGDLNKGFVHRATRDLVFRFPEPAARDALAAQLTAGTTTRSAVITGLMDTDEYRGLDVDRVFVKYLHRAADPSGRSYWIRSIAEGKALWRFRAQLFGSNEYFTKAGGTNSSYVAQAYRDVLGRDPDPSGRTYWTNKLDHGSDRGSVALQFINSPEARRRLVDDQFLRFLDRKPTTAEQTTWTATVGSSSTGEQQLIAFLAASGAYLNRS